MRTLSVRFQFRTLLRVLFVWRIIFCLSERDAVILTQPWCVFFVPSAYLSFSLYSSKFLQLVYEATDPILPCLSAYGSHISWYIYIDLMLQHSLTVINYFNRYYFLCISSQQAQIWNIDIFSEQPTFVATENRLS